MTEVLVFKTSVSRPSEVGRLSSLLNALIHPLGRWNFDLEDRDNILRVEASGLPPEAVCEALLRHGHRCVELH